VGSDRPGAGFEADRAVGLRRDGSPEVLADGLAMVVVQSGEVSLGPPVPPRKGSHRSSKSAKSVGTVIDRASMATNPAVAKTDSSCPEPVPGCVR
jgi:hypothetical protein